MKYQVGDIIRSDRNEKCTFEVLEVTKEGRPRKTKNTATGDVNSEHYLGDWDRIKFSLVRRSS